MVLNKKEKKEKEKKGKEEKIIEKKNVNGHEKMLKRTLNISSDQSSSFLGDPLSISVHVPISQPLVGSLTSKNHNIFELFLHASFTWPTYDQILNPSIGEKA